MEAGKDVGAFEPWILRVLNKLSQRARRADNSRMRSSMSLRLGGLVATLVISGGLWLYSHGGGSSATTQTQPYCHDVDRLTTALTTIKQGGDARSQAPVLASIGQSLSADATTAAQSGQSIAAASLTRLAQDVTSWRTSILTSNAVNETIALDRILSEVASVPGC